MRAARAAVIDPKRLSQAATTRLISLDQYQSADCVMWYVGVRDELSTLEVLPGEITSKRKVVVPYCVGTQLELFHLESVDELEAGKFGILEPRNSLRQVVRKRVSHAELSLIVVPGVAFDAAGGRLGHGMGYYDRCLEQATAALFVAVAFDCQMVTSVPTETHDIPMDFVVTESAVHRCDAIG